jgi:hypothetical protein
MIFFVLTKSGYVELVAKLGRAFSTIWLNAGILSESEIADLRQTGVSVTVFKSAFTANNIADYLTALATIQEHHPGEQIWVEHVAQL